MAPQSSDIALPACALVVSEVCFLRESLVEILGRAGIRVCRQSGTLAHALSGRQSFT